MSLEVSSGGKCPGSTEDLEGLVDLGSEVRKANSLG